MSSDEIVVKKEPVEFQTPAESIEPPFVIDINSELTSLFQIRNSPVSGRGLFVHNDIKGGWLKRTTNLGKYCAPEFYGENVPRGEESCSFYGFAIRVRGLKEKVLADAMDEHGRIVSELALCNHSFNPNIAIFDDGSFIVLRNIKAGKEVFINYGMSYWLEAIPKFKEIPDAYIRSVLTPNPKQRTAHTRLTHIKYVEKRLNTKISKLFEDLNSRTLEMMQSRKNQDDGERKLRRQRNKEYIKKITIVDEVAFTTPAIVSAPVLEPIVVSTPVLEPIVVSTPVLEPIVVASPKAIAFRGENANEFDEDSDETQSENDSDATQSESDHEQMVQEEDQEMTEDDTTEDERKEEQESKDQVLKTKKRKSKEESKQTKFGQRKVIRKRNKEEENRDTRVINPDVLTPAMLTYYHVSRRFLSTESPNQWNDRPKVVDYLREHAKELEGKTDKDNNFQAMLKKIFERVGHFYIDDDTQKDVLMMRKIYTRIDDARGVIQMRFNTK